MTKRVLVNLNASDQEPYWAFVSTALMDPRRPAKQLRRPEPKSQPKAFANPRSWGYGGGETPWPFDINRARWDVRYRTGIRNALAADWTASNWKYVARKLLLNVLAEEATTSVVYKSW